MENHIPPQPAKSFRIVLDLDHSQKRLDNSLLTAFREQNENAKLKTISRAAFKQLFTDGKVLIKGQRAKVSSALAKGITYVDVLGF